MKLEQQVVSLELSKRLKELGVVAEYYFVWHREGDTAIVEINDFKSYPMGVERTPAFTVAELGEMLPSGFEVNKYSDGEWSCQMPCSPLNRAMSEVDARAKFLISLLENKLITL